ncbi:MAG: hypothetical protein HQK51_21855, partial [Oligoflexia bacterium]|nr:hypothetical protein [Oligoflexia bacterium]
MIKKNYIYLNFVVLLFSLMQTAQASLYNESDDFLKVCNITNPTTSMQKSFNLIEKLIVDAYLKKIDIDYKKLEILQDHTAQNRERWCSTIMELSQFVRIVVNLSGIAKQYDLGVIARLPIDVLDVSFSNLEDDNFKFFQICKGCEKYDRLSHINVSNNNLTKLSFLKTFSNIAILDASKNRLTKSDLGNVSFNKDALLSLDLSNNLDFGHTDHCVNPEKIDSSGRISADPFLYDKILDKGWLKINIANTAISCLSFIFTSTTAAKRIQYLNIDGTALNPEYNAGAIFSTKDDEESFPFKATNLSYLSARNLKEYKNSRIKYFPLHIFRTDISESSGMYCFDINQRPRDHFNFAS